METVRMWSPSNALKIIHSVFFLFFFVYCLSLFFTTTCFNIWLSPPQTGFSRSRPCGTELWAALMRLFILNADSNAAKLVTGREWNTCKNVTRRTTEKVASRKPRLTTAPTFFFLFSFISHIFSRPSNVKSICAVCGLCVCAHARMCVFVLDMGSRNLLKTASEEAAAAEVCLSLDASTTPRREKKKINVCQTK